MNKILLFCFVIHLVKARPQLLTFKDGNVGVNFGGYHAEAGLGGLLTGDAAHGGLSASAGTPFGQKAGAGLAGTLNGESGRTAGGGYAGATAGHGVGASAAFGGGLNSETGGGGGVGAEAHVPGKSTKVVQLTQVPEGQTYTAVKTVESENVGTRGQFDDNNEHKPVQPATTTTHKEVTVTRPRKIYITKQIQYGPYPQQQHQQQQPQQQHQTIETTNYGSPADFDYRKFVDFGFFSNAASNYGGPHVPTHTVTTSSEPIQQSVNIQSNANPSTITVQKQFYRPPRVFFRKNFILPRFNFRKTFRPFRFPVVSYNYNYGTGVVDQGNSPQNTHTTSSGSSSTATSTTTNTQNSHDNSGEVKTKSRISTVEERPSAQLPLPHGSNTNTITYTKTVPQGLFNDIFNIPISTLNAVNQFLNNGARHGGFHKTVQVSSY